MGKKGMERPRENTIKDMMQIVVCQNYREMKILVGNIEDWLQRQGIAFRRW